MSKTKPEVEVLEETLVVETNIPTPEVPLKKKVSKLENNEDISSPMGSLEEIKTIPVAPRPTGEIVNRVRIPQIFITNFTPIDQGLWWDGKEYIYKARSRAPVQIGGVKENQAVRRKWAYELATREYYRINPPVVGGKSRLPRESELTPFVQKALIDAPIADVEYGKERVDEAKPYHVLKSPSEFPELSAQM